MPNVNEIALAEFNAWMAGVAEYHELSPAGQARVDEYLDDLDRHFDALAEAAGA